MEVLIYRCQLEKRSVEDALAELLTLNECNSHLVVQQAHACKFVKCLSTLKVDQKTPRYDSRHFPVSVKGLKDRTSFYKMTAQIAVVFQYNNASTSDLLYLHLQLKPICLLSSCLANP